MPQQLWMARTMLLSACAESMAQVCGWMSSGASPGHGICFHDPAHAACSQRAATLINKSRRVLFPVAYEQASAAPRDRPRVLPPPPSSGIALLLPAPDQDYPLALQYPQFGPHQL